MSATRPIDDLLRDHPWFSVVDAADLRPLGRAARARDHAAGEILFQRGDPGDGMVLLADGLVRLSVVTAEGRELTVRLASGGEAFGEIAMLDGASRSTDATAVTAAKSWWLPRADVLALMDRSAAFRRAVVAALCARLRDTTAQLEAIALMPVEVRVARVLRHLAAAHVGRGRDRAVRAGHEPGRTRHPRRRHPPEGQPGDRRADRHGGPAPRRRRFRRPSRAPRPPRPGRGHVSARRRRLVAMAAGAAILAAGAATSVTDPARGPSGCATPVSTSSPASPRAARPRASRPCW